jgi:fatty-acyl-CoA synthase
VTGPTYRDLIVRGAHGHRERIALTAGTRTMTFGDVDELSSRLANTLLSLGVPPRARVGLLLNNSLLSVPVDFACVKANLNRVPLNARLSLDEHTRMLVEARVRVLLYGADLRDRAIALAELVPELHAIPLEPGAPGEMALTTAAAGASSELPDVDVRPSDVVLTLFTSGTTGTLKAAQHTQASYAAICRNVLLNLMPARADDAMLHAASLIHASGVFVLPCWLRGARTVIMPAFEPAEFLRLLEAESITAINLVPTMLQMLLQQPGVADRDFSALRYVIYGASPIPQPVLARALEVFGRERFFQYYGQTECPLCITVLRPEDHVGERLRSCGKPCADVELKLIDANGDQARGREGEIAVRAPSMMAGYFDAPELDAEMRLPGGWLRTRDLGVLDDDGFLYLLDRTSDMIVTGGYNVYPREVEDVLLTHPAVRECAVIGVADETWVEAVAAVVVTGADVSEAELIAFCRDKLASYKKPQRILFETALPKTAVGKISRKTLRDRYREAAPVK